jgi:uncharacterized membrane protein (UPF0127 family)
VPWLVRDDEVLASAEVAADRGARRRGLLGRDACNGALLLQPCRQVHTVGLSFPIDVVWCAPDGAVLRIATMKPRRISRVVPRARFVIEAAAGSAGRWKLNAGDVLEVVDRA